MGDESVVVPVNAEKEVDGGCWCCWCRAEEEVRKLGGGVMARGEITRGALSSCCGEEVNDGDDDVVVVCAVVAACIFTTVSSSSLPKSS